MADFRRFLERAADLVASYGGSLSGEHGDGQSRGELLTRMFDERLVTAFGELKALFDPGNRMNPGKIVHPNPVDGQLRLGPAWRPRHPRTHFGFPEDDHSFNRAVMRCVGIGNCRSHSGGVMCPSYRATKEEEHSTRRPGPAAVRDARRTRRLRDRGRLALHRRPRRPSTLPGLQGLQVRLPHRCRHGHPQSGVPLPPLRAPPPPRRALPSAGLPLWARLSRLAPALVNSALHAPGPASGAGKRLAGVDAARPAPCSPRSPSLQWWRARDRPDPDPADPRTVLLWPDTFSTYFHPSVAISAVRVLEDAGFQVAVPDRPVCCGPTWISTGQLPTAKRVLRHTLGVLRPTWKPAPPSSAWSPPARPSSAPTPRS